nr:PREDICTED: THO complex subunit 3 [Apteryx mantelli mantelli]
MGLGVAVLGTRAGKRRRWRAPRPAGAPRDCLRSRSSLELVEQTVGFGQEKKATCLLNSLWSCGLLGGYGTCCPFFPLGENINICWSPDGQTIAVGNKDDVVTFIDAKTHRSKAEEQFKFEVNEISWNNDNNMFFLTNGNGCINILSYPELKPIQSINAHPSNCICIKFDPMGKYFATGSADALVSLWDVDELVCVRCFSRLDWPVRTLSFSHDGKMLASASEDHFIDIAEVETGEKLWEVQCESPTFTVAWHPKRPLLAFACDDKDGKYDSSREAGTVKLFGLPNDS